MTFKKNDKLVVVDGVDGDFETGSTVYALADSRAYRDDTRTRISLTLGGNEIGGEAGWYNKRFKLAPATVVPQIDFSKPLETLEGETVEIVTRQGRYPTYPVIAYVGDRQVTSEYTADGFYFEDKRASERNLRNAAPKPMTSEEVIYKNVYAASGGNSLVSYGAYTSREAADTNASSNRVGVTKVVITMVEGQYAN